MKELANHPSVLIPAQLAAYLLLFAVLARLFHHHYRIPMFQALSWSWPARWPLFLASGVLLALAAEAVSHFLPTPPEMPIDKMLRTPSDAWMLAFFGVLIAPFVEELLFRGLLFPALIRRVGLPASLVTTAVLFGVVHAQQLAGAWIQISCIVAVGIVLTVVRWRAHSLACSTLVHVGYNGALFTALFIETQAFTNFSVK